MSGVVCIADQLTLTMTLFQLIAWSGDFSFTIRPLRLKPLCSLRKQLSKTAYEVNTCKRPSAIERTQTGRNPHTTSYFFSSWTLDSRDEPCHTKVFSRLSVWSSISFLHCMIATVGLQADSVMMVKASCKRTYATTKLGLAPMSDSKSAIIWMVLPILHMHGLVSILATYFRS